MVYKKFSLTVLFSNTGQMGKNQSYKDFFRELAMLF